MTHIDENTLELLALGDERTRKREKQIRRHLAGCEVCSRLYQEIKSFYEDVEREMESAVPPLSRMAARSLVRKRNELEPYFAEPEVKVASYAEVRAPSVWRRINRFSREHPVGSTIGLFAIAAALALSAGYLWKWAVPDSNPAYVQLNPNQRVMEVFNRRSGLLWSLPVLRIEELDQYQSNFNAHETIVSDLEGDGTNEVITAAPLPGNDYYSPLRVYNGKGGLERSRTFEDGDVTFAGEHYYSTFKPSFLISDRMAGGTENLFVVVNNGRSPCYLARLDPNLRVIGKYWHYGTFVPYKSGIVRDSVRYIIITGIDDMGEMSGDKSVFVAVLDPTKIVGDRESIGTPGFGLAPSTAEMYYIKLPNSSISSVEALGMGSRIVGDSKRQFFEVQQSSPLPALAAGYWGFDFVFSSKSMAVEQVKYNDPTPETFQMLKKEGKLKGNLDKQYLENLKNGVRYWDGKEWVKKPTRILHSELATQTK